MHVTICGAGVIGACCAYFLSRQGVDVTVVERAQVAVGASGKSGGFLALDWNDGSPLSAFEFSYRRRSLRPGPCWISQPHPSISQASTAGSRWHAPEAEAISHLWPTDEDNGTDRRNLLEICHHLDLVVAVL